MGDFASQSLSVVMPNQRECEILSTHSSKNRSSQGLKHKIFLTIWACTTANGTCTRPIFLGDKSTITACFTTHLSNLILVKTSCDEKKNKVSKNLFPCFGKHDKTAIKFDKRSIQTTSTIYQTYFRHIDMICGRIIQKLLLHIPCRKCIKITKYKEYSHTWCPRTVPVKILAGH